MYKIPKAYLKYYWHKPLNGIRKLDSIACIEGEPIVKPSVFDRWFEDGEQLDSECLREHFNKMLNFEFKD